MRIAGPRVDGEDLAAGPGSGDGERGRRQVLQVRGADRRREGVAAGWRHLELVATRPHYREAVAAGLEGVELAAAVAGRGAGDDGGREGADPVVAEDGGRRAGVGIKQGHRRTVDGQAGVAVEDPAEGVDHRGAAGAVAAVEAIRVGGRQGAFRLQADQPVVGDGRIRRWIGYSR